LHTEAKGVIDAAKLTPAIKDDPWIAAVSFTKEHLTVSTEECMALRKRILAHLTDRRLIKNPF
jgi:hypothetical protein